MPWQRSDCRLTGRRRGRVEASAWDESIRSADFGAGGHPCLSVYSTGKMPVGPTAKMAVLRKTLGRSRLRPPAARQQLRAGGDAQTKKGSAVARGALMQGLTFM